MAANLSAKLRTTVKIIFYYLGCFFSLFLYNKYNLGCIYDSEIDHFCEKMKATGPKYLRPGLFFSLFRSINPPPLRS